MGYDIKILDCHGGCRSCYEARCRRRPENLKPYHLPSILSTLDRIITEEKKREEDAKRNNQTYRRPNAPCLHGGEPLLIEFHDLRAICRKIHGFWGCGSIQTSLVGLTQDHITLFQEYGISVGVSLDGDTPEMNRGRWNAPGRTPSLCATNTEQTLTNMALLRNTRIPLSVICVLRRFNARAEMIPDLIRFILRLHREFGVTWGRTNPCIVFEDRYRAEEELSPAELGHAFKAVASLVLSTPGIIWQPYHDVVDMMLGYLDQTCNFNDCDPFYTTAEEAINGVGDITNCLKSGPALHGIQCLRAAERSSARSDILYQLPQTLNGCKKCQWWWLCMGGCPGEGIDNDWRNRTRFCSAWRELFAHVDGLLRGMVPNLMLAQDFYPYRPDPEWCQRSLRLQGNPSSYNANARSRTDTVLQENEASLPSRLWGASSAGGAGRPHGDRPHGDHTDQARRPS